MTADELTDAQYHKLMDAREVVNALRTDKRVASMAATVSVSLGNLLDDLDDLRIDADLLPPF